MYVYELMYEGEGTEGESFLIGLVSTKELREKVDLAEKGSKFAGVKSNFAGVKVKFAPPSPPVRGADAGGARGKKNSLSPHSIRDIDGSIQKTSKKSEWSLKNFMENIVLGHPTGVQCLGIMTKYLENKYKAELSQVA